MASTDYHYIITGAGCAGLSLLMRMMEEPFFQDKKILVVDQYPKNKNDRTWCFWEKESGIFEPIVKHHWKKIQFLSDHYSATLDLDPYQYKMIQGIDFYQFVLSKAANFSNIEFRHEKVDAIITEKEFATVQLASGNYRAEYLFNSILFPETKEQMLKNNGKFLLLQHFKGWMIKTKEPAFDSSIATMMDFRTSQQHGTTFFYVMPLTSKTALVEYTLFSESILPEELYQSALNNYIKNDLNIPDFEIEHEEFGIISMTNKSFPLQNKRIVQMGLAGGQAKGSSGYAFQFIQKRTAAIINDLKKGKKNFHFASFNQQKGQFYDSVLLQVLTNKKMLGADIFSAIFSKNKTAKVLRFLDNESSVIADLQIMHSVPTSIFFPAALKEIVS
jgi:lycopene beta-cyclase